MGSDNPDASSLFRVGDNVELWRVLEHLCFIVVFVIVFEQFVHALEHMAKKHAKYHEIMSKIFGELMIFGFIGLGIKLVKEIAHLNAYSKSMIAFQAADIMVFVLAIALIIQAISIFLKLRSKNIQAAKAELISSAHLVDMIKEEQQKKKTFMSRVYALIPKHWFHRVRRIDITAITPRDYTQITETRILRHYFLKTYKLPDIFPFSEYLRHAQDNQINHMIEVEISAWIILLLVGLLLVLVSDVFDENSKNMEEHFAIVAAFMVFSWLALALHLVIYLYFLWAIDKLLEAASGDTSGSKGSLFAKLQDIALAETLAEEQDEVTDAIAVMQHVRDAEQARVVKRRRSFLTKHDTGFQLISTLWRKASTRLRGGNAGDVFTPVQSPTHNEERVNIRWFSRKAWHFVVMSSLMLNGFYFALFCQCIVYQLGDIVDRFRLAVVILIPLPLITNMLTFQPRILRAFILVSSIHRVDDTAMSEVIDLFTETVELRAEFVHRVNDHLVQTGQTLEDIRIEFERLDVKKAGMVDVDDVRLVLSNYGFNLSFFRFHSVAKLLFQVHGTEVEYDQVLFLVSLGRKDDAQSHNIGGVDGLDTGRSSFASQYSIGTAARSSPRRGYLRQQSTIVMLHTNPIGTLRRRSSKMLRALYHMNFTDTSARRLSSSAHEEDDTTVVRL